MRPNGILPRKTYHNKILRLLDNGNVMFVLGLRRAGKSSLLKSLTEQIAMRYADEASLSFLDGEEARWRNLGAEDIIKWFEGVYAPGSRNVIIADELGCIENWERAAEHIASAQGVKLIISSSNRRVLTERFAPCREGKADIVELYPMSMEEYIAFYGIREITSASVSPQNKRFKDEDGAQLTAKDILSNYLIESSVPPTYGERIGDARSLILADGRFSSVIVHDILEASCSAGLSAITDQALLRCMISVLVGAMGRNISATWIGKQTPLYLDRPSSTKTVESYLRAIVSSHLFYMVERYDIKADQKLKTLMKYYIADMGIYRLVLGRPQEELSAALENRVYFELLRRGYEVYNGKFGEEEVKFMAVSGHDRVYVQTADLFRERDRRILLSPLRKIKDNHPKVIIVSDTETRTTTDGILIMNALEFFMGGSWERSRGGY